MRGTVSVYSIELDTLTNLYSDSFSMSVKGEIFVFDAFVDTGAAYTSGTSYLDGEMPTKESYDKSRRLSRGKFRSNSGECINADVNGAYQIIKKFDAKIPVKHRERVIRMNVA